MTLSELLDQGAEWLVDIGCPPDADVVLLAQDVVARTRWLEDRGLMPVFTAPRGKTEPGIAWFIGLLRVLWAKTNHGGALSTAEHSGDQDALDEIKNLNGSSRRLRTILESAQQDEAA